MKKEFVLAFFLIILAVAVLAAENDGWDSINDPSNTSNSIDEGGNPNPALQDENVFTGTSEENSGKAATKFTRDFYIALGVGAVGILLIVYFISSFLRSPKNKWKK